MPTHLIQTSFNAGEISDRLIGHVDLAKIKNGARCLKNFLCLPHGGVSRRAGTMFLGRTKDPSHRVRLIPFIFSNSQAYIIEAGVFYFRFWTARGLVVDSLNVPVEVVTPYTETELRELRFTQSADFMWFTHIHHPPQQLVRVTATEFQFNEFHASPPPTFEQPVTFAATLTLSAATGNGVTATTSSDVFLAGDRGRNLIYGAGRASITGVTSATSATVDIIDAFPSTGPFLAGTWTMDGSPNYGDLNFQAYRPIGLVVGIPASPVSSTLPAFRSTDVGKYLVAFDGSIRITQVYSTTAVTGVIVKELTQQTTTVATSGLWTLESSSWSDDLGWPGVVALYAQRLWFAGSPNFPDSVWASVVGDFRNFGRGANDDDGLDLTISENGLQLIRAMKGGTGDSEVLLLMTIAGEFTLDGGADAPITPTNVRIKSQANYGSDYTVDAVMASGVALFVQRGAQRVRENVFVFQNNKYQMPDVTILAEHLTRDQIAEMIFAITPDPVVFALRPDGVLLSMAYDREQEVVGWSSHETCGLFDSIAAIPNACGTSDELWTATRRTLTSGAYWDANFFDHRFFDTQFFNGGGCTTLGLIEVFDGQMNTDAGLLYSGVAVSSLTGAGHLEGKTVKVITSPGCSFYDLVVTNGVVTLPAGVTATSAEVGLGFVSTLETLRPEYMGATGTAQGRKKSWTRLVWRVYCTSGHPKLQSEALVYPNDEGVTDPDVTGAPFTGDLEGNVNIGWSREQTLVLQQVDPKPLTVLAFIGGLEVSDSF
jgi:hypothetical protein